MKTRITLFLPLLATFCNTLCAADIHGVVTDHQGEPFADMPVRAIDADGNEFRTYSDADGRYSLPGLAAGVYHVQVTPPCCSFNPYESEAIQLDGSASRVQDVSFSETLIVEGDDPGLVATELKNSQNFANTAAPRMADGTPDLSGVWLVGSDPYPAKINALPDAEAVANERRANAFRDHPHTNCLPSSPPIPAGASPFLTRFVQTGDMLVILFEDVPGYRQVYLDGRAHPDRINPSWMGHSIGRWEGNTLVVDTIGFNDGNWIDAYSSSYQLHMVERYTRSSYGEMSLQVTFEDPEVFIDPYVQNLPFNLAPQVDLLEYVCENNQWSH